MRSIFPARLSGQSRVGEIVAVAPVLDRARTLYDGRGADVEVKGKALEIEAHVVGESRGRREADARSEGALIGRVAELAQLVAALAEARAGRQQVVELVGPPGIGKSRLLAELSDRASDAGFDTSGLPPTPPTRPPSRIPRFARSYDAWRASPTRLPRGCRVRAREPCHFVAPRSRAVVAAARNPPRCRRRADARGVGSRRRDKSHPDPHPRRVLPRPIADQPDAHGGRGCALAGRRLGVPAPSCRRPPGERPWFVCVTTRPGVDPFAQDHHVHASTIELAPLADDVASSLTLGIAAEFALSQDDVQRLVARAGGNPLFVRELVTAARAGQAIDTLPDTVESLLTTRIDTLDPADRNSVALCLRRRAKLPARLARRDRRRRDPRCGSGRSLGSPRRVRDPAVPRSPVVPPRSRARHCVRGPFLRQTA